MICFVKIKCFFQSHTNNKVELKETYLVIGNKTILPTVLAFMECPFYLCEWLKITFGEICVLKSISSYLRVDCLIQLFWFQRVGISKMVIKRYINEQNPITISFLHLTKKKLHKLSEPNVDRFFEDVNATILSASFKNGKKNHNIDRFR